MPDPKMLVQENAYILREEKVLEFIQSNRGCTKTSVIVSMEKNGPSPVTTNKILKRLIEVDKKVISRVDIKNSRIHHLYINDKNEFIQIKNELLIIKSTMDAMDDPIEKILRLPHVRYENDEILMKRLEEPEQKYTTYSDLYHHFIYPYEEATTMQLQILSRRVSKKITNLTELDSQLLQTKIAGLMLRLTTQIFDITREKDYLDFTIKELQQFHLSSTEKIAKKNMIDTGIRKNIINNIRNFEGKFIR